MIQLEGIAIRETIAGRSLTSATDDARPGILVAVNSSSSAYNALAYALSIARAMQAAVRLFHVTDANELGESGNPLVISRMLDRMEKKASNCVRSLKEMIEESGVPVSGADSMIGNVERLVANKVADTSPDFLVLGKGSLPMSMVKNIAFQATAPVIVVPDNTQATVPVSVMLSGLGGIFKGRSLEVACKLIHGTASTVTAVSVRGGWPARDPWMAIRRTLGTGTAIHIDRMHIPKPRNVRDLVDFVHAHEFDLVCLPRTRRSVWQRLFRTDNVRELPFQLEIPSLLL